VEHDAIKREVGVVRMLVEKTTAAAAAAGRGGFQCGLVCGW
jgi:hypothetical protein